MNEAKDFDGHSHLQVVWGSGTFISHSRGHAGGKIPGRQIHFSSEESVIPLGSSISLLIRKVLPEKSHPTWTSYRYMPTRRKLILYFLSYLKTISALFLY